MPIMLGGLFQIAYNVTDTLFVSWIDKNDSTYINPLFNSVPQVLAGKLKVITTATV